MKLTLKVIGLASVLALVAASSASAQSIGQPSADWNANWGFNSPNQQAVNLGRAELIERAEGDGFGSRYYTTNNVSIDQDTLCEAGDGSFYGGCASQTNADDLNESLTVGNWINIDNGEGTVTVDADVDDSDLDATINDVAGDAGDVDTDL